MSPRESDAARVAALRAGDSDAFERLYGEYSAPIYNLCARVVCDREEAKDLTQDVFITAFNQLRDPAAEPVRKLKPWLYRVATNACYNHLRSRKHLTAAATRSSRTRRRASTSTSAPRPWP